MRSGSKADNRNQNACGTCTVCSCFGLEVAIHWTFPFCVVATFMAFMVRGTRIGTTNMWIRYIAVVILYIGSAVIHELARCFVAKLVGGKVYKIVLWPYGGFTYSFFARDALGQLCIFSAGSLARVLLIIVFWLCCTMETVTVLQQRINTVGFRIQVYLLLINMLIPLYPLDGGGIFVTLLQYYGSLSAETTGKIILIVNTLIIKAIAIYAVLAKNYFFLLICVYIGLEVHGMFRFYKTGNINHHPLFMYTRPQVGEADVPQADHDDTVRAVEYTQESRENETTTTNVDKDKTTDYMEMGELAL